MESVDEMIKVNKLESKSINLIELKEELDSINSFLSSKSKYDVSEDHKRCLTIEAYKDLKFPDKLSFSVGDFTFAFRGMTAGDNLVIYYNENNESYKIYSYNHSYANHKHTYRLSSFVEGEWDKKLHDVFDDMLDALEDDLKERKKAKSVRKKEIEKQLGINIISKIKGYLTNK